MPLVVVWHPLLLAERLPQIWEFLWQLESPPWQKWYDMNYQGILDAVGSSSHPPYTSKEGYEPIHQQWVSLLVAQHPISLLDKVSLILYFMWNLRDYLDRNGMVWTIRGSMMLPEATPTFLMHPRKVMNHFNNNGCLFSQYSIPFPGLIRYPKSCSIVCVIWESTLAEMVLREQ